MKTQLDVLVILTNHEKIKEHSRYQQMLFYEYKVVNNNLFPMYIVKSSKGMYDDLHQLGVKYEKLGSTEFEVPLDTFN